MKKLLILLPVIVLATTSCRYGWHRVGGNGNIKTQEHTVSDFRNVELSGGMNIYLSQGPVKPVKIETDDNLLPYIEVIQQGEDLIVRQKPGYDLDASHEVRVYVTAPSYRNISVSGAGNIYSEQQIDNPDKLHIHVSGAGDIKMDMKAPAVDLDLSGAGSINLSGETKDVDLRLSGAGNAHCYDLKAENATVHISGVGDAEVFASVSVDAHVSGVGSVKYKGGATNVSQDVSGAGSVKKVE